jgi:hypothetical protein
MTVRPWAGFIADFPDDQVESDGDIKVFGGRNVAVALGEILAGLGCRRGSEPEYVGEQGWEFDIYDRENRWFRCHVTSFHPAFWLFIDNAAMTRGTRNKNAAAYVEIWRKLAIALEQDPRFHRILWRSAKDGPPDEDEIAAASDPPDRSFEEDFPLHTISAREKRPGWWPIIFVLWIILSGLMSIAIGLDSHGSTRREDVTVGVMALVLAPFALLWAISRRAGR